MLLYISQTIPFTLIPTSLVIETVKLHYSKFKTTYKIILYNPLVSYLFPFVDIPQAAMDLRPHKLNTRP